MYNKMTIKQLYVHVTMLENDLKTATDEKLREKLEEQIREAREVLQKRVCVE